ncbi:30S ribosomal protein S14 [candidate division CPR3 bacterium GWF2_35_18]|nr:MAG: 30S ribosomal protein S14 [candidate division CPR3 bacterium GWF2_35_18]OGB64027.1 MAG: 30S ribosomal protein S14 [candidate division CPR3 bacterium RIFOXYA2_FULL_35_13]OGB75703.1 MAG: 30S ribosomal protein S14 [candidate division CPR3 bacterium RIFOXYC2_FULL_35_7]OGB79614.1 MAG: 30S ribosomal protein S14 [candidate division CPR3 bacterium RIFOXYB2_FULL_35_8]OGB80159.1 MAG: 30S ribosomal protein S14 [candidate division CPR3 bacterium GWE2_35_7]
MPKTSQIERSKKTKKYKVKETNRCTNCGRKRGYYRFFGLCRICLREMASRGEIPGVKKSSW